MVGMRPVARVIGGLWWRNARRRRPELLPAMLAAKVEQFPSALGTQSRRFVDLHLTNRIRRHDDHAEKVTILSQTAATIERDFRAATEQ